MKGTNTSWNWEYWDQPLTKSAREGLSEQVAIERVKDEKICLWLDQWEEHSREWVEASASGCGFCVWGVKTPDWVKPRELGLGDVRVEMEREVDKNPSAGPRATVGSVEFLSPQLNRKLFRYFCRKRQCPVYVLRSPVWLLCTDWPREERNWTWEHWPYSFWTIFPLFLVNLRFLPPGERIWRQAGRLRK